jgi:hypothetical protein
MMEQETRTRIMLAMSGDSSEERRGETSSCLARTEVSKKKDNV